MTNTTYCMPEPITTVGTDLSGPISMPETPTIPETEPDTDEPATEPDELPDEPAPYEPEPEPEPATPEEDPDTDEPESVPEEDRPFLDPSPTEEPSECPAREPGDDEWETCSLPGIALE